MTRRHLADITSGRFFWLLIAIVVSIVLAAGTPPGAIGRWESSLPVIGILIAATFAARGGRARLAVTLGLNSLLLITGALCFVWHIPGAQYACFSMLLACLLFTVFNIMSFVLTAGRIGPDHIYGAICAYVLIAMCFATIYTIQALAIPGAFSGVPMQGENTRPWEDLLYFSFTTLSTVGYGDITPIHRSARAVCSIEMLTGTFYVAILIARLAGLYPPPSAED